MGEFLAIAAGEFRWAKGIWDWESGVCYTPLDSCKTFISRSPVTFKVIDSIGKFLAYCHSWLSCDYALSWFLCLPTSSNSLLHLLYFSFSFSKMCIFLQYLFFSCPIHKLTHVLCSMPFQRAWPLPLCPRPGPVYITTHQSIYLRLTSATETQHRKPNSSSLTSCSNELHPCFSSSLRGQPPWYHESLWMQESQVLPQTNRIRTCIF